MRKLNDFTCQGKNYKRDSSMIGDTEKITWFEDGKEVFDQELLEMLEHSYETALTVDIWPILPLI